MAQLTIVYDTMEPPLTLTGPQGDGIKIATLPISDDLNGVDVYEVARRLAELLLEQLR